MTNLSLGFALTCAGIGLVTPAWAQSGPSTADPEAPLALRSEDATLVKIHADGARLIRQSSTLAAELVDKANRQPKQISLKRVGQAYVAALAAHRAGDRLAACGEVAGVDLQLRADALERELYALAVKVRPNFAEKLATGLNVLRKAADERRKVLAQCEKLLDQGKLDQAADRVYAAVDFLEAMGVWYNPNERDGPLGDFVHAGKQVTVLLSEADRQRIEAELTAALAQNKPDYAALLARIDAAAAEIGQSGRATVAADVHEESATASLAAKPLAGPDALAMLFEQAGAVQERALAALAMRWVHATAFGRPATDPLESEHNQFVQSLPLVLAKVIVADAARASGDEAAALYEQYVDVIAQIALGTADPPATSAAFTPALVQLAGRADGLADRVAAYHEATGDLLRWRKRSAESAARRWRGEYPPTPADLPIAAELATPAPLAMAAVGHRIVGQKHACGDLVGTPASKSATSPYVRRLRARIGWTAELAVASLQSDLLIGPPPLSVDAALALRRAARGDVLEAGGEVTGVELEPLVPLLAHLTAADAAIAAIGPLTGLADAKTSPERQVRMRVDLAPKWLRLEHAFLEVE